MPTSGMGNDAPNHAYSEGVGMRHRGEASTSISTPGPSTNTHHAVRVDGAIPSRPARRDRAKVAKGRRRREGGLWGIGREGWVEEGFRQFGEHCARNQIRTLLIDCLVMTNLFYPSLAIYLQKRFPPLHPPAPPSHNIHRLHPHGHAGPAIRKAQKEHPLSLLSTPILDSFFPYPPPLLPRLNWAGWWGRDTGQSHLAPDGESTWSVQRPQGQTEWLEEEIRLVRVGWADVAGILDGEQEGEPTRTWLERDVQAVRFLQDMADRWETHTPNGGARCVRIVAAKGSKDRESRVSSDTPDGKCFILSAETTDLVGTTGSSEIVLDSSSGADDTPYHQISIPFQIRRGAVADFEEGLAMSMEALAQKLGGEVFVEAKAPSWTGDQDGEWLLSYTSKIPSNVARDQAGGTSALSSSPPNIVWLLYLALFSFLGHQLSNASKVHSRFGLAFTGCVQLCCSAVMSFSLLALFGWNGWGFSLGPTTLPTYILPSVIVIVGAENMSTLTKAVFSVPFTYSVPDRIGLALGKSGKTIALKSLSDIGLLTAVWLLVNIQPVRAFCVFAIVVVITDWFMLHTFFLTILSIDAQRLELADVLASTSENSSPAKNEVLSRSEAVSRGGWKQAITSRTGKGGSLILWLACIGVIYYLAERHRLPDTTPSLYGYHPPGQTSSVAVPTPTPFADTLFPSHSPSETLWRSINPAGWPAVRVSVPPATIIVLPHPGHSMAPSDLRKLSVKPTRLVLPRLKPLFYLFKVVVLPQAVTATALYILLLYLLKDADLLDAQRNRLGRMDTKPARRIAPDLTGIREKQTGTAAVQMLPASKDCDIEVIASSQDGGAVMTIGLDNSVHLWRFEQGALTSGTRERVDLPKELGMARRLLSVVSETGRYMAIASQDGWVQFWETDQDGQICARELTQLMGDASLRQLAFKSGTIECDDPFVAGSDFVGAHGQPDLLASFGDGSVRCIDAGGERVVIPARVPPSGTPATSRLLPGGAAVLVDDGDVLELWRNSFTGWSPLRLHSTRTRGQRVTCGAMSSSGIDSIRTVIAIGFDSGLAEVHDEHGNLLATAEGTSRVKAVDLVPSGPSMCVTCLAPLAEGFWVVLTCTSSTQLYRVHPRNVPALCRCKPVPSRLTVSHAESSSLRASPSSTGTLGTASAVIAPLLVRQASGSGSPRKSPGLVPPVSNGEFPLSSHGTRRYSALVHRDDAEHHTSVQTTPMLHSGALPDETNWSELEATHLGAVASEGGSAVLDGRIVALHRAGVGVGDAQWQVVTLDLSQPWNGATLVVNSANLATLGRRMLISQSERETSFRDRREERILSLSGRATFGSLSAPSRSRVGTGSGGSVGGNVGTPGMAYVEVRALTARGKRGIVGGFGNRLGIIDIPKLQRRPSDGEDGGQVQRGGQGVGSRSGSVSAAGQAGGGGIYLAPPGTGYAMGLSAGMGKKDI